MSFTRSSKSFLRERVKLLRERVNILCSTRDTYTVGYISWFKAGGKIYLCCHVRHLTEQMWFKCKICAATGSVIDRRQRHIQQLY